MRGWYAAVSLVVVVLLVWLLAVLGLIPLAANIVTLLLVVWIVGVVVSALTYGRWP